MATKNKKKSTTKKTASKPQAAKDIGFFERVKAQRAEKKLNKQIAKEETRKAAEKSRLAETKAKEKAKQQAIKQKALEEVTEAVDKTKKRRSNPLVTLLLLAIIIGLSGAFVWQYREQEIVDKNEVIDELNIEAQKFVAEKQAAEAAKQAEEARFKTVTGDSFNIRIPSNWEEQSTQYPLDEVVYGDENVTLRVIRSETRNSVEQFIPEVDYIWEITDADNALTVSKQSLHCERFDTISNDLSATLREHDGFMVYCDQDSEKVVIAALATPDNYATEQSGTYFMIEINDVQQVRFDEIKDYIESYNSP